VMVGWIERAEKVLFQTYARFPLVFTKGEGARLWDDQGRCFLDLVAGLAVCNVGHCHPKVVRAIQEQSSKLLHVSNFYYNVPMVELAERLVSLSFADRVFFCNSGAEANEGAIKLARKFAKDRGKDSSFEIITMNGSFHGRTMATLTATAQEKYHKGFEPMVEGFRYVPFGDLDALKEAISPRTCAVMVEPIQGEGGVRLAPPGYLKGVRELCDKEGILLILDEVQTGMGRTGTLFAHESEGVTPHVMTLAKGIAGGIPMGVVLATEDVAMSLTPGTHASTFGGNPVAAAAANAVLEILIDDGLLEQMAPVARSLKQGLERIAEKYPELVVEVRGRGLMLGMELREPCRPVVEGCMRRGVLVNCTVEKVLRLVPPLVITLEDVEEALQAIEAAMVEAYG
jgi:acetylornithine/N-succinyldiaminopimelate aminotransferase